MKNWNITHQPALGAVSRHEVVAPILHRHDLKGRQHPPPNAVEGSSCKYVVDSGRVNERVPKARIGDGEGIKGFGVESPTVCKELLT
jgi:hypothetical protein